jgi:hypothetical protein
MVITSTTWSGIDGRRHNFTGKTHVWVQCITRTLKGELLEPVRSIDQIIFMRTPQSRNKQAIHHPNVVG